MTGDEPPVDGMAVSVRLRREFTVTDAGLFLAAARRMHRELHPEASEADAAAAVTSAADAVFTVLESAGLIGPQADDRLAAHGPEGLVTAGWRAEVAVGEPAGLGCFDRGDGPAA